MSLNIKNTVIVLAFTAVTIPFIFITDLFPFLRFGMFAEPVRYDIQKEVFLLTYKDKDGTEKTFHPEEIGIEPHFFYYLTRNYYYRNESSLLIRNIQTMEKKQAKEWILKRIIIKDTDRADTTIVYRKGNE